MKSLHLSLALVATFLFVTDSMASMNHRHRGPRAAGTQQGIHHYVEGEVLVKYRSGAMSASERNQVLSRNGVASVRQFRVGSGRWTRTRVQGKSVEETIQALKADPDVESAQPNFIYHILKTPNDPKYSQQWAFKNTGQTVSSSSYSTHNPGTSGDDMGLESAWNLITDCSSVPVAVIDTGINYAHEDLAGSMWDGGSSYPNHGYNFVDNNNDPTDLNGHGTHVAGIIGALGNNSVGLTGVCWKANLMALRVLGADGSGTTADIAEAVDFAVQHGAKVINMSLGGGDEDATFQTAIQNASDSGVVIVVAAGNEATDNDSTPSYPCSYGAANLVCVAAVDQAFNLASFSNYGATSVHVGAPGTNILSTYAGAETYIDETFHASGSTALNWTKSGTGWGYGSYTLTDGTNDFTVDALINPTNWDGSSAKYANNADARTYKSYNLSGLLSAQVGFSAFVDIDSTDSVTISYRTSAGDPFASGSVLDQFSGSSDGSSTYLSYDLSNCLVANCTVGFRLRTDATKVATGMAIYDLSITKLSRSNSSYMVLDGTSMATPEVAGIAAMLFAYNASYSASDVVQSIKEGGVASASLSGKTTTGKSASAFGSLSYIAPVAGVSASASAN